MAIDPPLAGQPARHSRRFSNELVEDARKLFQEGYDRQLTNEDARQMLENLVGFFTTLHQFDRAQLRRSKRRGSKMPPIDKET